jgi:hypothetical protein
MTDQLGALPVTPRRTAPPAGRRAGLRRPESPPSAPRAPQLPRAPHASTAVRRPQAPLPEGRPRSGGASPPRSGGASQPRSGGVPGQGTPRRRSDETLGLLTPDSDVNKPKRVSARPGQVAERPPTPATPDLTPRRARRPLSTAELPRRGKGAGRPSAGSGQTGEIDGGTKTDRRTKTDGGAGAVRSSETNRAETNRARTAGASRTDVDRGRDGDIDPTVSSVLSLGSVAAAVQPRPAEPEPRPRHLWIVPPRHRAPRPSAGAHAWRWRRRR